MAELGSAGQAAADQFEGDVRVDTQGPDPGHEVMGRLPGGAVHIVARDEGAGTSAGVHQAAGLEVAVGPGDGVGCQPQVVGEAPDGWQLVARPQGSLLDERCELELELFERRGAGLPVDPDREAGHRVTRGETGWWDHNRRRTRAGTGGWAITPEAAAAVRTNETSMRANGSAERSTVQPRGGCRHDHPATAMVLQVAT